MDNVIEVRDLTKRYGPTLAVDGLSFEVLPGRVTGFLGPNGAGKSTTLRLVLGLDAPNRGSATVGGRPYGEHRRPLHEVGALLEAKAYHPGRTAHSHLLSLAQASGIPRRRVDEVLELVGLTTVARHRAGTFSLGMAQRMGIAAALLGDPGVLIFDEPLNGLDPEGIIWVRTLMRSLAAEGRTVFVSSHLMSEMAITADHLIVIGRGRLIADTAVADFVQRSSQSFVRIRTPQPAELAQVLTTAGASLRPEPGGAMAVTGLDCATIGDLANAHRVAIHELSPQQASLEAAFMELTQQDGQFRAPTAAPEVASPVGARP